MGQLLAEMALREHLEVSWLPSSAPGDAQRQRALPCFAVARAHRLAGHLATRSAGSDQQTLLHKFAASVVSGGLILYNNTKLPEGFSAPQARVVCVPASEIADRLGSAKVANVVMLARAAGRDRMSAYRVSHCGARGDGEEIPSCSNWTAKPSKRDATTWILKSRWVR